MPRAFASARRRHRLSSSYSRSASRATENSAVGVSRPQPAGPRESASQPITSRDARRTIGSKTVVTLSSIRILSSSAARSRPRRSRSKRAEESVLSISLRICISGRWNGRCSVNPAPIGTSGGSCRYG